MPNAKDFKGGNEKFLIVGGAGTGKTTLFTTLPGKKFMYLFDPNALNSIAGEDIDYELYTPDVLNMNVIPLSKDKISDKSQMPFSCETYLKWEQDFEKKIRDNFFKDYNALGIDSFTTLADLVMDRVQFLNGRYGKQPEQDDWSAQINTIKNIYRNITSLNLISFTTAHKDLKQDNLTKRIEYQIMMPGQLRSKLPILFSEIYGTSVATNEKGELIYQIQTFPDRFNPVARCSLGLGQFVDVTIPKGAKDKTQYGLGKILREHPRNKV